MSGASSVASRMARLGLTLPEPPVPQASYDPGRRVGGLIFVSGQLPFVEGVLPVVGTVGRDVTLGEATELARQAMLNSLAVAAQQSGGLERLQAIRLTVWVASAPTFNQQHLVADGASSLLIDVLGDSGRHARAAVAAPVLPLSSPVEVEAIFAIEVPRADGA